MGENYISKVNNDKSGDTKEQKIKKIKNKWSKKPLVKEPSTGAELDYIYNMMVSDTSDGFRNKAIRKDKNNNKKLTDEEKKQFDIEIMNFQILFSINRES